MYKESFGASISIASLLHFEEPCQRLSGRDTGARVPATFDVRRSHFPDESGELPRRITKSSTNRARIGPPLSVPQLHPLPLADRARPGERQPGKHAEDLARRMRPQLSPGCCDALPQDNEPPQPAQPPTHRRFFRPVEPL